MFHQKGILCVLFLTGPLYVVDFASEHKWKDTMLILTFNPVTIGEYG